MSRASRNSTVEERAVVSIDKGPARDGGCDGIEVVADLIPQLLWSADADGAIDFCNQRWLAYTGMAPEDVVGDGWVRALHPDDFGDTFAAWRHATAAAVEYAVEQRLRRHDGAYRWFLARAVPHRDSAGRVVRWIGTCTDIHEQKAAAQTLRDNEARLWETAEQRRLALQTAQLGTWTIDLQTGGVTADERFLDMFGVRPPEQLTRELATRRIHPADLPRVQRAIAAALDEANGGLYEAEHRVVHPDGTVRWLAARARVRREATGEGRRPVALVGTAIDLTDYRRAEEAAKLSEERYRALVQASAQVVWTGDADCRSVDGSAWMTRFTGRPRAGDARRDWWHEAIHPDDRERVGGEHQSAVATRRAFEFEFRLRRHDGVYRSILIRGVPMFDALGQSREWIGTIQDTTERRATEEALRDNEARLRAIVDQAAVGIATVDPDGVFRTVNPGFSQIVGRPPEAVLGLHFGAITHPEDLPADAAQARRLRDGEIDNYTLPKRYLRPDGTPVWVEITCSSVKDARGEVSSMIAVVQDIGERQAAEQRLRDLNATLEQRVAQRTALARRQAEQLRQLALDLTQAEQRERRRVAMTLHDHLQQILVAAKMRVDILAQRVDKPELQRFVEQAGELIGESIGASRTLAVELSPPVLYERGLPAALEWLGRHVREKLGLTVRVRIDAPADPEQDEVRAFLLQAVQELLFNVRKHAGVSEASVTLASPEPGRAEILIEDGGKGFDPAAIAAATQPSEGFGLTHIRQRLDLLGGDLRLRSAPGQGCRVTLSVPLGSPLRTPAEPKESAEDTKPESRFRTPTGMTDGNSMIRVLLVDDHKILREGLAGLLQEESDIQLVGEAADGRVAVELAERLHPDVVIMDVTLPVMDGVEATRRIKMALPDTRVIGLSMHEKEDLADAMSEAGASLYLTKGCPAETLMAAIRSVAQPA